jgi:hypothetical protein
MVEGIYCESQGRTSLQPTPEGLQAWDILKGAGSFDLIDGTEAEISKGPAPSWFVTKGDGNITTTTDSLKGGMHTRWDTDDDEGCYWGEDNEMDIDAGWEKGTEKEDLSDYDDGRASRSLMPSPLQIMKVILPHHKEEREWGSFALEFELPFELAMATYLHLTQSWPMLNLVNEDNNFMLIDPYTGEPLFRPENLSTLWRDAQSRHKAPWAHFAPMAFRDIHIMDKVQHLSQVIGSSAEGYAFMGDATIMQNTVGPVWEKHYHKGASYWIQMARGVVDKMTNWKRLQYERRRGVEDSAVEDLRSYWDLGIADGLRG